tara:strand:- start:290 stop:760 length:471 start_codon:yes stop_codon:yes gene_type:complete
MEAKIKRYLNILYPDDTPKIKKSKVFRLKQHLKDDEFNLNKEYFLEFKKYLDKNIDFELFKKYKYNSQFCKIKHIVRNIYEKNDEIYDREIDDEEGGYDFQLRITEQASLFKTNIIKKESGKDYRCKTSCDKIKLLNFCFFMSCKYNKNNFLKEIK